MICIIKVSALLNTCTTLKYVCLPKVYALKKVMTTKYAYGHSMVYGCEIGGVVRSDRG